MLIVSITGYSVTGALSCKSVTNTLEITTSVVDAISTDLLVMPEASRLITKLWNAPFTALATALPLASFKLAHVTPPTVVPVVSPIIFNTKLAPVVAVKSAVYLSLPKIATPC